VRLRTEVAEDGRVTITVADAGIGMTEAELATALQPFRQVESIYTRRAGGTGLGLPIVRGLMDLHGGSFELNSRKGDGTTATISFPAATTRTPD
jgi:two-component system cell cycle sensor histidine kinase PleC